MNESTKYFLTTVALIAAYAGISFLLSPVLSYLFFILSMFLALLGYSVDMFCSLIFWWAGYDGSFGDLVSENITVLKPLTAWAIFMAISFVVFLSSFFSGAFGELDFLTKYRMSNSNKPWQQIWMERDFKEKNIWPCYIRPALRVYNKYTDEKISKSNARKFFFNEMKKQSVNSETIEQIWRRIGWMFGVEDNDSKDKNGFYKLESAELRKQKIRSLCTRASFDFTPKIKKLKKQFKEGEMSKEEVMTSLFTDFAKWREVSGLSDNESKTVWKSICKRINL